MCSVTAAMMGLAALQDIPPIVRKMPNIKHKPLPMQRKRMPQDRMLAFKIDRENRSQTSMPRNSRNWMREENW